MAYTSFSLKNRGKKATLDTRKAPRKMPRIIFGNAIISARAIIWPEKTLARCRVMEEMDKKRMFAFSCFSLSGRSSFGGRGGKWRARVKASKRQSPAKRAPLHACTPKPKPVSRGVPEIIRSPFRAYEIMGGELSSAGIESPRPQQESAARRKVPPRSTNLLHARARAVCCTPHRE